MRCPLCDKNHETSLEGLVPFAECRNCRIAYQVKPKSRLEALAFSDWGWRNWQKRKDFSPWEKRAAIQWRDLQAEQWPGKTVLDYGAGMGAFLSICRKNHRSATGWEPSETARCLAKAHYNVDLMAEPPQNGQFDIVMLYSVLEHVFDGRKMLDDVRRLVGRPGKVLIKTPVFGVVKGQWWAYQIGHPCLYSKEALCKLMDEQEQGIYVFERAA